MTVNTGSAVPRMDLLGPILQEGISEDSYVAHHLLPPLLVQKRSGVIPSFLFTDNQALSIKHAPRTAFARVQAKLGEEPFNCTEAGVEESLTYEDYEILGRDYAQELTTRRLVHIVLRSRDVALANALFSAGGETLFATNLVTAGNAWNTSAGTPLNDVLQAKRNIALRTGLPGNAMLISYDLYIDLCRNTQIQTMVRNVLGYGGGQFTQDAVANEIPTKVLAMTFGLDEIIIAPGVVNSNASNDGTNANLTFIWPRTYALVFRKAKNATDVREVALGRTFVYDLASEFNQLTYMQSVDTTRAMFLEAYPEPNINADTFRCREYIDMNILFAGAGALIKST
jgi:hypothetical protein